MEKPFKSGDKVVLKEAVKRYFSNQSAVNSNFTFLGYLIEESEYAILFDNMIPDTGTRYLSGYRYVDENGNKIEFDILATNLMYIRIDSLEHAGVMQKYIIENTKEYVKNR